MIAIVIVVVVHYSEASSRNICPTDALIGHRCVKISNNDNKYNSVSCETQTDKGNRALHWEQTISYILLPWQSSDGKVFSPINKVKCQNDSFTT